MEIAISMWWIYKDEGLGDASECLDYVDLDMGVIIDATGLLPMMKISIHHLISLIMGKGGFSFQFQREKPS